ncbi:MAG: LuxR C-terminal-related transcriptional regulator [Fuerstiella sp.]
MSETRHTVVCKQLYSVSNQLESILFFSRPRCMIELAHSPHPSDTTPSQTRRLSDEVWQAIADADVLRLVQQVGQQRISQLSPREQQVLREISEGHSNKMIAHHLQISAKTVEKHRGNVMKKMQVSTVPDLMRLWFQAYPHDLQLRDRS